MKELARDNTQLLLNKIWEVRVCPDTVRFFCILSALSPFAMGKVLHPSLSLSLSHTHTHTHSLSLSIISSAVQLPIEKRDGLVLAEVS